MNIDKFSTEVYINFFQIQKFHSVLHLILRDVPSPPQPPPIERPASATSDGVAEIALPMNGTLSVFDRF